MTSKSDRLRSTNLSGNGPVRFFVSERMSKGIYRTGGAACRLIPGFHRITDSATSFLCSLLSCPKSFQTPWQLSTIFVCDTPIFPRSDQGVAFSVFDLQLE